MISILRKLPKLGQMLSEYFQDMWQFVRHNSHSPLEACERRVAFHTVIEAHTIEKGLALPTPRPLFGEAKIQSLLCMNPDPAPVGANFPRAMLLGALETYANYFCGLRSQNPALFKAIERLVGLERKASRESAGGLRYSSAPKLDQDAMSFLAKRYSARIYAPGPLSLDEVKTVVRVAQVAPSQCNRQSCRVYVFRDRDRIDRLLALQGGARGFGETVPTLFLVCSEITAWGGPQQRNQPYVDGGLFSMQLILALTAHGILSCPLNLAVSNACERRIRRTAGVPDRERVIMMIAAGYPLAESLEGKPVRVAGSPRRPLSEVLVIDRTQ